MTQVLEAVKCYTIPEVAALLGVSRSWVYERITKGVIRTVELGDTTLKQRVRADDLQAFIDARTFGSAS